MGVQGGQPGRDDHVPVEGLAPGSFQESAPLHALDLDLDPHVLELRLGDGGNLLTHLAGVRPEQELQFQGLAVFDQDAVGPRFVASFFQQFLGLVGVIVIVRYIGVVDPTGGYAGRIDPLSQAVHHLVNDLLLVQGIRESLPHPHVLQVRTPQVEADVGPTAPGQPPFVDGDVRVVHSLLVVIWGDVSPVYLAVLQHGEGNLLLGHDADGIGVQAGLAAEVTVVGLKDDVIVLDPLLELEGP